MFCFRAAAKNRVLSEKDESDILMSSLRDANLAKFLTEDLPLFENILTDLFPDITPDQVEFKSLEVSKKKKKKPNNNPPPQKTTLFLIWFYRS